MKNKFLTYVAFGVLAVLLVYFVGLFFSELAKNKALQDMYNQNLLESKAIAEENDVDVGNVYFTLNWQNFADSVVVQLGTKGNILKDESHFYYIFKKDPTNANKLIFNGILRQSIWGGFMWSWDENFTYYSYATDKEYCDSYLEHEFSNIFTGNIYNLDDRQINGYYVPGLLKAVKKGGDLYLTKNASTYVPSVEKQNKVIDTLTGYHYETVETTSYKVALNSPLLNSLKLFNEINQFYLNNEHEDVILKLATDYFTCYSYAQAQLLEDNSKGYVNFNLRVSVDYTGNIMTNFDFENLDQMWKLIKDYSFYEKTV